MHEVLVNRLGGLSLPRKSVVRLTDHPDMTLDVYCGRKTTIQQQQYNKNSVEHYVTPALTIAEMIMRWMDDFMALSSISLKGCVQWNTSGILTPSPTSTPGLIVQSVGHLTCKSEVLGSIPGLATYFPLSFR